jgi:membrane protein implicated in regulation of membrane protease activity
VPNELSVWFWLVAFVAFLVVEGLTFSLVSVWFAGGALAAMVFCALGAGSIAQIAAFVFVSAGLLALLRPSALRKFQKRRVATNSDRVIGARGVVIQRIAPADGTGGQVKVLGQTWSALPSDGASVFEAGAPVQVDAIAGVKLLVRAAPPQGARLQGAPPQGPSQPGPG